MLNTIEFINIKNKFLDFYEDSKKVESIQDKFDIWKEKYDFAAVPPTEERLAMRVSKEVASGLSDYQYITNKEEWYKECNDSHSEIVTGILPYVKEETSEVLFKFTMGSGTTDHEREAYYVAWKLFDRFLKQGFSLSELARISQEESKNFVEEHVEKLL